MRQSKRDILYDAECEVLARHFLDPAANGGSVESAAKRLAAHIQSAIEDWIGDQSRCECGDLILPGQTVIRSVDGGFLHYDCCGDDREGFVDENDEPLAADAPLPQGFVWTEENAAESAS